jgi:hypothetical protein
MDNTIEVTTETWETYLRRKFLTIDLI